MAADPAAEALRSSTRGHRSLAAAAGESAVYVLPDVLYAHAAVTVAPGQGGAAALEASTRAGADVAAGNASWAAIELSGGGSSAELVELSPAVTAIRLSATTAPAAAYVSLHT